VSNAALQWARECQCVKGPAKAVLLVLADAENKDGESFPNIVTLCRWAGVGKRAAIGAVAKIEAAGLVSVARHRGRGSRYALNRCTRCTGAPDAPVHDVHGVVHEVHPTGAPDAPGGARGAPVTPTNPQVNPHSTAPPCPPSGGWASEGEPSIPDLESLALECKPASRRRGSCLTTPEARKLVELADKYGPTAVRDALLEAGGAEMPVAFAAKVLRSRPAERRDEDWDKIGDQRQAERAALRAMTPEQRAERFAPAVAAFARLAKGG
jgi:hypothetical protein